jgi:transcriptional regulator with XRE-family HTH domain
MHCAAPRVLVLSHREGDASVSEAFGTRLRQQRERRHITLEAIAVQTKIKVSHLEGLERGDLSDWPSGIFRRAFVRAYAAAIGLDPDAIVRECAEVHPDPEEVVVDETEDAPSTRFGFLLRAGRGSIERLRSRGNERSDLDRPPSTRHATPAAEAAAPIAEAAPAAEPAPVEEPAPPVAALASWAPDLTAAAQLCTDLARMHTDEPGCVEPMLAEAARILDAAGVVVWVWQPEAARLRAVWAHGYSDALVGQLPALRPDAPNVTAAAFRSSQTCVVNSGDGDTGAVTAPLPTPDGCIGVLAMEFRNGHEREDSTRALAAMFAALLARAVVAARPVAAVDRRLA